MSILEEIMDKVFSRRSLLKWAAIGGGGVVLAACQPKVVKETVVVEKVVEKQVEKVVTQVVKETVMVEGTPQVVEKVVEKEVTAAPMAGWEGTIEIWSGGVQPDIPRGEGLDELHALRELGDEWEEMHPGAKLDFIAGPGGDEYDAWLKSRQAAGTTPDICWAQDNFINRDIGAGYWVSVDPWINTPNPYIPEGTPGHDRWRDAFIAGFSARNLMIDKRYYGVPQSYSAVQVYANVDLLEEAGIDVDTDITSPRWTFDSMLEVSQQIKDAGFTPWALNWASPYWVWIQTSVFTGMFKSTGLWDKLDTNGDDFVTGLERFEAIMRGDYVADCPELRATIKIAKDWVEYWAEGYLGLTNQETTDMFMRGEAAFMWNGTWYYPTMLNDPERDFDFKVVRFPDCAERMAEIGVGGTTTYPGGACDLAAITQTAADKGSVESCIDFMKYYISCDGQSRVCKEHGGIPPVVRCAEGNPALKQFAPAPGETLLKTVHMRSMNAAYADVWQRLHSEYLSGRMTIDEFLADFQPVMEEYAADATERGAS